MKLTSLVKFFRPSFHYSVKIMNTLDDFEKVKACRIAAYSKQYPNFHQPETPDELDASPSTTVFMVQNKRTHQVLGTMRIRHSLNGRKGGAFEVDGFTDDMLAEPFITVERFAVIGRRDRTLIKILLFSGLFKAGNELGIDKVYAYAIPSLQKLYAASFGFIPDARNIVLNSPLTNNVDQRLLVTNKEKIVNTSRVPFFSKLLKYYSTLYSGTIKTVENRQFTQSNH